MKTLKYRHTTINAQEFLEAAKWLSMNNLDSIEWLPADLEVVKRIMIKK